MIGTFDGFPVASRSAGEGSKNATIPSGNWGHSLSKAPVKRTIRLKVLQLPGYSNKVNPYNAMLCDALVAAGAEVDDFRIKTFLKGSKPDILHVHWPEWWLSQSPWQRAKRERSRLWLGVRLAKLRGAKLIWTAHNLRPHERHYPDAEARFYREWIAAVDGIIALSRLGLEQLEQAYPAVREKPRCVIPHGDFRPRLRGISRQDARLQLGIPAETLLVGHFGLLRPYKNTPLLIRTFVEASARYEAATGQSTLLIVAGSSTEPDFVEEVKTAAAGRSNVRLEIRYVEDAELEGLAAASNLVAMPFRDILNSGSALYALSAGTPILVPAIGAIPELQADVGADWVHLYSGEFTVDRLESAMVQSSNLPDGKKPKLDQYHWDRIGSQTLEAYQAVLKRSKKAN